MSRTDFDGAVAADNAFGYNNSSEVTEAAMGTNAYSYGYDPIGNRLLASANGDETAYAANRLNQYSNITCRANSPQPDSHSPAYDADGNMTFYVSERAGVCVTNRLFWDAENRLVCVSNDSTVVRSVYDDQSRRIRKEVHVAVSRQPMAYSLQSEVSFLYDGWNVIREVQRQPSCVSTNFYTWGLDLSGSLQGAGGVGGLLAVVRNTAVDSQPLTADIFYPCYDANGNVTAYLDDVDGSVVARYDYDPFGNTVAQSGDMSGEFAYRFSTKYWDNETGLYYYGYRFYCSEIGRWINRDPIREAGGVNWLMFVSNRPVNAFDLMGLKPSRCTDECKHDGKMSGYDSFKLFIGPIAPKYDMAINDSMLATIEAYSQLPTDFSYSGMASWFTTSMGTAGLTEGAAMQLWQMMRDRNLWSLYIIFNGKKCRLEQCCAFWDKLKNKKCIGYYQCKNGPYGGKWPSRTRIGSIDTHYLTQCEQAAKQAFDAGSVACEIR